MQRHTKPIDTIVIHCTATPEGRRVTIDDVRRWHVKERGWDDIGYHFLVRLDGAVAVGRPTEYQGAHVKGHNDGALGVAYVGGVDADGNPKDTRTPAQKHALAGLIARLESEFGDLNVYGHRDFPGVAKACPGFDAAREYERGHRPQTESLKPISDSRTLRGSIPAITGAVTAAGGVLTGLGALSPTTQAIIGAGLTVALLGACYVVWNRWQERRRGER